MGRDERVYSLGKAAGEERERIDSFRDAAEPKERQGLFEPVHERDAPRRQGQQVEGVLGLEPEREKGQHREAETGEKRDVDRPPRTARVRRSVRDERLLRELLGSRHALLDETPAHEVEARLAAVELREERHLVDFGDGSPAFDELVDRPFGARNADGIEAFLAGAPGDRRILDVLDRVLVLGRDDRLSDRDLLIDDIE